MTDTQPDPVPAPPPPPQEGASPYRNLWVPLVVVPFLVVGVLVLVFLFFGAIRGRDATLSENLRSMVEGGANQRQQAAVNLVIQVMENYEAALRGEERPWEEAPDLLAQLQGAWELTGEDDNLHIRLALARVLAVYEDPVILPKLTWFLELDDEQDPDGQIRFGAMEAMGMLADPAAAATVIPFLGHEDLYLRLAAAAALQALPGPESVAALKGVLAAPELELRGMAAISLSHLGDPSGAHVLLDLIDPGTYEAVRAEEPLKYTDARLVQNNRIRAVQALARLGRPEDGALLEALAEGDQDPAVREAAMIALRDRAG